MSGSNSELSVWMIICAIGALLVGIVVAVAGIASGLCQSLRIWVETVNEFYTSKPNE